MTNIIFPWVTIACRNQKHRKCRSVGTLCRCDCHDTGSTEQPRRVSVRHPAFIGASFAASVVALASLTGCASTPRSVRLSGSVTTVRQSPAVTGACSVQSQSAPFDPDTDQYTAPIYTVTLTDTSSTDDDVTSIATTFDTAAGTEMASDQQEVSGIIAPGQSLSWSFSVPDSLISSPVRVSSLTAQNDGGASWNDGDTLDQVSVTAQSCQFAQWSDQ
jgi:hypothetical protein